jgi:hypothetical protein
VLPDFFGAVFFEAVFLGAAFFVPVTGVREPVLFFAAVFDAALLLDDWDAPLFLAGALAPLSRASLRPIAMACLREVTFLPLPLFSFPCFISRMASPTLRPAAFEYFAILLIFLNPPKFLYQPLQHYQEACDIRLNAISINGSPGTTFLLLIKMQLWLTKK